MKGKASVVDSAQVGAGSADVKENGKPYTVEISVVGLAPILLHGWNNEAVADKSAAGKGTKSKKTDDLESYVVRVSPGGPLGLPGVNFRAALIEAGRYRQDPRSPRKAMRDLLKAALVSTTEIAPFEPKRTTWEYEDRRRAVIQRNAITRVRPALREGWKLTFGISVLLPEYVSETILRDLVQDAGRFCALGDFRPTYGRFALDGLVVVG